VVVADRGFMHAVECAWCWEEEVKIKAKQKLSFWTFLCL